MATIPIPLAAYQSLAAELQEAQDELRVREAFIADAISLLRSHQNKERVEPFLDDLFSHKKEWLSVPERNRRQEQALDEMVKLGQEMELE